MEPLRSAASEILRVRAFDGVTPQSLVGSRAKLQRVWSGDAPTLYVEAKFEGQNVLLAVDSAFAKSYVSETAGNRTGKVTVGGKTVALEYLAGIAPTTVNGVRVVGTIGADLLMRGTTILDAVSGRFENRPMTAAEKAYINEHREGQT